jgi:N-acetylmuramic acid 6-phosphate (MurNAc-6-P) etherase
MSDLRITVARLMDRLTDVVAEREQFRRERDEAREMLAAMDEDVSSAAAALKEGWARTMAERDEAQAALAKAEGFAVYLSQAWRDDCLVGELQAWLKGAAERCMSRALEVLDE